MRFGVPPEQRARPARARRRHQRQHPRREGDRREGRGEADPSSGATSRTCSRTSREVTPPRARSALEAGVEAARLSRELATLRLDAPVDDDFERFAGASRTARACASCSRAARLHAPARRSLERRRRSASRATADRFARADGAAARGALARRRGGARAPEPAAPRRTPSLARSTAVADRAGLEPLARAAGGARRRAARRCSAPREGCVDARPLGLALVLGAARAASAGARSAGRRAERAAEALRGALEAPGKLGWLAEDTKRVQGVWAEHGLELALPAFDVGLAAGLLDATGAHDLTDARRALPRSPARFLGGSGRPRRARAPAGDRCRATSWRASRPSAPAPSALLAAPLARRARARRADAALHRGGAAAHARALRAWSAPACVSTRRGCARSRASTRR